jgi:cohesin complex subunit SA-1/2
MNQSADLQNVVEDLLESLTQSPDATLAELINCILRACGCNNSIDSDQVADYDGIVDVLEDVTDALKKVR